MQGMSRILRVWTNSYVSDTKKDILVMTAEELVRVDLSNVIQDAQIIASQSTLDALLVSVVKANVKHTCTQKSVLLLIKNDQLQVKAISNGSSDNIVILQATSPEALKNYPHAIVEKVYACNTIVTLNYSSDYKDLANDPYLTQHQPASRCCVPICYQDKKFDASYPKNSADVTSFEAKDIQTLYILLSQMALFLNSVQKITKRQNGTITAKSTPGKNTTFIIILPNKQSY